MFATIGYYICIPFAWLLRALYELTSSYGWALVLFTAVSYTHLTLPTKLCV